MRHTYNVVTLEPMSYEGKINGEGIGAQKEIGSRFWKWEDESSGTKAKSKKNRRSGTNYLDQA